MASFREAVASGQPLLLDGGLATQLEARGHDLSDTLWSARLLLEDPDEVRAAHADFFAAGAQVATTASYQVSASGFAAAGLSRDDAEVALRRSVQLAREAASATATDDAWVAASVGPYGAALADGSEYRGDYGLSVTELRAWHRPRLEILADAGADVLALETIPCLAEVEALLAEIDRLGVPAWLSLTVAAPLLGAEAVRASNAGHPRSDDGPLSAPDATAAEVEAAPLPTTRLGESIAQAYAMAADVPGVVAVGANCFDPELVADVARAARPFGHPVIAYPNSGELWDADARAWTGEPTIGAEAAATWRASGVQLIGGCCRVGPDLIASMRSA